MTRAVVTGGAGFIGSHMVDLLLEENFEVRVIDNLTTGHRANIARHLASSRFSFHQTDMRDLAPTSPIFDGVDFVFHFGGLGDIVPSIELPADYLRANVDGTVAVLEASRRAGVRKFLYAASSSCYGLAPVPTTEDAPIRTEYPYAFSKYVAELAALHWAQVYQLPVLSLRLFNVYGPRVRTTGVYGAVFGVFLAQRANGQPLTVVGDGTQRRDFIYVTDVARAFLVAAQSPYSGEVFNVGAGNPQPILRLVELIGGAVVHVPKRPGEPDCTWADIGKITSHLGWKPEVAFEHGVAAMLQDLDAWRSAPLWTAETIAAATKTWFGYLSQPSQETGGCSGTR